MKKAFHSIYFLLGSILCELCLIWFRVRDAVSKPETDAILFVAHPDDDTLFFHTFIKAQKPYVVLLFTGWSIKRLLCFLKVMRYYGVRFRAYHTVSADAYHDPRRRKATERHVKACLSIKPFAVCATHGKEGEYGHGTHKLVHEAVMKYAKCTLLTTVPSNEISRYSLESTVLEEKKQIFRTLYTSETWAIEQLADWMEHEKLIPVR